VAEQLTIEMPPQPAEQLQMQLREERQASPVEDPVGALVAVARPILVSILGSIGADFMSDYEDRGAMALRELGRRRKEGDGDTGIAFEYAIHDAVRTANPIVNERVADALTKCRITQGDPASILFAIEKQGSQQLIDTELGLVTDESRWLSGTRGQPPKLKNYMSQLAAAFRRSNTRPNLPQSIRGLWKADLFLGSAVPDHWVGTTVKYNPKRLEAAPGLRIAIVPTQSGHGDSVRLDDAKNLVICPIPHDASFVQTFHEAWRIVQALCEKDFKMPRDVDVPSPVHREAARIFVERRDFPIGEVIAATEKFSQPHLLDAKTENVATAPFEAEHLPGTRTIVGPFPLET
jgi:hypothetical protein